MNHACATSFLLHFVTDTLVPFLAFLSVETRQFSLSLLTNDFPAKSQ